MKAVKKITIALLLTAQLVPLFSVLAVPTTAFAQSTREECQGPDKVWTEADGSPGSTGSCASKGAAITPALPSGWFYNNVIVPLVAWLSSLLLDLGALFLRFAGYCFDFLVRIVVVDFGGTLTYMGALDAITIGWGVFRDFSNILIIGFFVFIAISIILGLTTFGDKRLIANVLVVAVLMNFSLLFTKLIIDGSNFFAYQIYSQMASANGTTATTFNIAEGFLRPMQVGSVWNTYELVTSVQKKTNSLSDAFFFSLTGSILLLAVAAVLFYGSFLIAWRGILFIILMLTAPLAFATYLIPTLAKGEYGWESWWKMLLNNAAFGPLLMIMLAISLSIINAAGKKVTTPIGSAISDPSKMSGDAWTAIFVYLVGVGLIFVSFRLASGFAGSIGGGFGVANWASKMAGLAPLALGAAFAGSQMRNRFGGRAALKSLSIDESIEKQRIRAAIAPLGAEQKAEQKALLNLMKQKEKYESRSKREFNFENTELGKILKQKGMPSFAGDTKGGYAGQQKKAAEEAAKSVAPLTVSNKDAQAAAREQLKEQQRTEREQIELQRETASQVVEAARSSADSVKRSEKLQEQHTQAEQKLREVEADAKAKKVEIDRQYSGPGQEPDRVRLLDEQEQRIKDAKAQVDKVRNRMQLIDDAHLSAPTVREAQAKVDAANRDEAKLDAALSSGVADLTKKIVEGSLANAQDIGVKTAHAGRYTSKLIRKQVTKNYGNSRLKDRIKAEKELEKDATDDSTQPPAATT